MVKERLAAWALRHAYGDLVNAGTKGWGRLLYVDEEGAVRDLGVYAVRELEGMAWAVGVAYRTSPVRYDRVRLAAIRGAAHRLAVALRK